MSIPPRPYVLVTPVRNEERTLGRTIDSITDQTWLPSEWVIVSDGSTDRTDAIIKEAAARHPWIRLFRMPPRDRPSFAVVVQNVEHGVKQLTTGNYEFIGLVDGDVVFQPDYFEKLIAVFDREPDLGLAGGAVIDIGRPRHQFPRNREDIPGAAQFFRRSCFERLGGLIAIPEGGWDSLTCAVARMRGYKTRLVTELVVDHLKPRNISQGGLIRRYWQLGQRDYAIGYHPLFELAKCLGRTLEPPLLVGGAAWWLGFCQATLRHKPRIVPRELVCYVRQQQRARLRRALGLGPGTQYAGSGR